MTFIFALTGGLLIAVAIQLAIANLGIALGLSVLDWSPVAADVAVDEDSDAEVFSAKSKRTLPVTHLLGFGVAVGFSGIIFFCTLLSVEFSELVNPRRGIVFGLIFWAAYWLLFVWLSSTTLAGIADSLLDSALIGGKQLVSTIKQVISSDGAVANDDGNKPSVERSMLEALVTEVSQLSDVQKELPTLLANQREALLAEICDRTNLSSTEAETIISGLEPDEPKPDEPKPDEPTKEPAPVTPVSVSTSPSKALLAQLDLPSWQQILRQAISKVDLSDWDFETLWQQLPDSSTEKVQSLTAQVSESAAAALPQYSSVPVSSASSVSSVSIEPSDTDRSNVEVIQSNLVAYCRYTKVSSLTADKIKEKVQTQRETYELLDDEKLKDLSLDFDEIETVLSRRKQLDTEQQQELMRALKSAWPTVVQTDEVNPESSSHSLAQPAKDAYQSLENYFQSIDWSEMSLEDLKPEMTLFLEQLEQEGTLRSIDWQQLGDRIQLPSSLKADFSDWFQTAWTQRVSTLGPVIAHGTKDISQHLADQITDYLHHQKKPDLAPQKIAESLSKIVDSAITTLPHSTEFLDVSKLTHLLNVDEWESGLWNKARWQQVLEARKDLTEEEIQQILAWGERVWQPKANQVGQWFRAIRAEVSERLPTDIKPDVSLPEINLPDADSLTEPLAESLAEIRQQIAGQIAATQEKLSQQAIALKEDLQNQADAARRQVVIAAWWLFIALVTSGSAAAGAGWLAAIY